MDRKNSLVSIIIPTYNRPDWLSEAIESCLQQTYQPIEIIVVDDGSTSNAAEEIISRYPQVMYIKQENQGSGAARNAGLKISKGEFVQFLDDDDLLAANAISARLELFRKHPRVNAVYSDIYLMDEHRKILGTYYERKRRPLPEGDIFLELLSNNFILLHALLFRREGLLNAGGFPHRSMLEDWGCLLRVAEFSQFAFLDQPLGYYRLHSKNISLEYERQASAYAETHQRIIYTERFKRANPGIKARLLCKFALKQWTYGDPTLGKQFLAMAKNTGPLQLLPWLLSGFMLFGRPLNRWAVRKGWQLRSRLEKAYSSRDYFLTKAGTFQEK